MRRFSVLIWVMSLISCNESGEKALSVKEYFDLDSLLDHQITALSETNLKLNKRVTLDGEPEEEVLELDTSRMKDEFRIFREFDLNKTNYVGAYEITIADSLKRYDLKPDQKGPVIYLEVTLRNDQLRQITGLFIEDKEIYQHRREIDIRFSGGLITGYSIKGFQDMVMKDTVHFHTEVTLK